MDCSLFQNGGLVIEKTIEERVLVFGEQYEGSPYRHFAEEYYEISATEQEAITKQEMFDKACEAFCDTLCPNECRLKNGICPFENQFRKTLKKAMEE